MIVQKKVLLQLPYKTRHHFGLQFLNVAAEIFYFSRFFNKTEQHIWFLRCNRLESTVFIANLYHS